MLESNRYRLNLYELIYQNPLCDYRIKNSETDNDDINVLFIGKKEYAIETYKTMFWASQYPDARLKMTYFGKTVDVDYVKGIFEDNTQYPALEEYIKKGYAEKLSYIINEDEEIIKSQNIEQGIEKLDFNKALYSYIIIATGDAYMDWEYILKLEAICEMYSDKLNKVMICIYNDGLNEKFSQVSWEKVAKNVRVCQFENTEEDIVNSDLRRIAANINLAYSIKYDERLNVADNLEEFDRLCICEFNEKNSKKYNADSSYASAVHISAKLSYCMEAEGIDKTKADNWVDKAIQLLAFAVENESKLYKKLYYWEHRRWNAYTVMQGYRHPNKGEWGFVYSDGRKNVDLENKLHVCLCDSGEELNPDMYKPSFWKKIKKELNPLDYSSYYCNNIARSKAKEVEKNIYVKYDFLNGIMFRELKEAIEDLFVGIGNSNDNYKKIFKKTICRVDILSDKKLMKKLKELNKELEIVIIRNQYINFFEYDAQLVKLIPFSLWYGEKFKEVFVFTNGIAAKDVIIPTLMYAKKVYFVSNDEFGLKYKSIIERYFEERGSNTESEFINFSDMLALTENKKIDQYVISGEGDLKEDFIVKRNDAINVRYNSKKNKINNIGYFCGLNSQSLSVKEFIHLQGGDIKDEFRDTFSKKFYNDIEKVFWDFSRKKKVGTYEYIPWNKGTKLLTRDSIKKGIVDIAIENISIAEVNHKYVYIYDACIQQEKYLENNIGKFLLELYDYHLISKLETMLDSNNIRVRLLTYHKEICEILDMYNEGSGEYKVPTFKIGKGVLSTDNIIQLVSKELVVKIGKGEESKYFADQYNDLYKALIEAGVLDGFNVKHKILDTIRVRDIRKLDIFEKEGDVFEKITFHRVENSNMFNDVKNGVFFYWNKEAKDDDLLKKQLKEKVERVAREDIIELIDAETLCKFNNEISRDYDAKDEYDGTLVSNEIDVIAIRGMQAYFMSCKATSEIKKEYLDEIANHAKNAGAVPVLAMGKEIEACSDTILNRATVINQILLLGKNELMVQSKFDETMNKYLSS